MRLLLRCISPLLVPNSPFAGLQRFRQATPQATSPMEEISDEVFREKRKRAQ